jgi:hypothetical protein
MCPFPGSARAIAASVLVAMCLCLPATAFAHGGGGGHGGGGHGGAGHGSSHAMHGGGSGGSRMFGAGTNAANSTRPEEAFFPDDLPAARFHRFVASHMPHLFGGHHRFGAGHD